MLIPQESSSSRKPLKKTFPGQAPSVEKNDIESDCQHIIYLLTGISDDIRVDQRKALKMINKLLQSDKPYEVAEPRRLFFFLADAFRRGRFGWQRESNISGSYHFTSLKDSNSSNIKKDPILAYCIYDLLQPRRIAIFDYGFNNDPMLTKNFLTEVAYAYLKKAEYIKAETVFYELIAEAENCLTYKYHYKNYRCSEFRGADREEVVLTYEEALNETLSTACYDLGCLLTEQLNQLVNHHKKSPEKLDKNRLWHFAKKFQKVDDDQAAQKCLQAAGNTKHYNSARNTQFVINLAQALISEGYFEQAIRLLLRIPKSEKTQDSYRIAQNYLLFGKAEVRLANTNNEEEILLSKSNIFNLVTPLFKKAINYGSNKAKIRLDELKNALDNPEVDELPGSRCGSDSCTAQPN